MGTADVRDESTGGLCRLYQRLDITGMRRTHLHHGDIGLFIQPEQRLGNSYVVVEIALRGHDVITLGENGTYQLLRGGLAVGTGNAYHRYLELAAVFARQVLEGLQAVIDFYEVLGVRCWVFSLRECGVARGDG